MLGPQQHGSHSGPRPYRAYSPFIFFFYSANNGAMPRLTFCSFLQFQEIIMFLAITQKFMINLISHYHLQAINLVFTEKSRFFILLFIPAIEF